MRSPKIFVALDYSSEHEAHQIINILEPKFCGVKVGKELFTAVGPKIVDYLHHKGFSVFLDLKYHDIPNTVKKACHSASNLGVCMLNVHALGGIEMMVSAKEGIDQSENNPLLIGVTMLTSHNQNSLIDIGIEKPINNQISQLAVNVANSGLDGIVSSANDLSFLKPLLPEHFHFITPGIRLNDTKNDDQKRVATPVNAIKQGSTILVVGRPITEARNPLEVLTEIQNQIK